MLIRQRIRSYQRGLWFKHGDFVRPLGPGVYWFPGVLLNPRASKLEIVNTLDTNFNHPLLQVLVRNEALRSMLEVIDLTSEQRAIVWKDGRLFEIVGPGRRAYWKQPASITIERFEIGDAPFNHPRLETILAAPESRQWLEIVEVQDAQIGLAFRSGKFVGTIAPGKHVFWKGVGSLRVVHLDLREKVLDVAGQEIMTSDKVTLRMNLVVTFQISDPALAATRVSDVDQALYREAQLALRAAVGTRPIDTLLSDKESVGNEVRNTITARAAEYGVTLRSIGLRDIMLPGEMKTILNRVIEAQKNAEAEIIKRREETASARSQLNTAKLLAENPILARMKELELLQAVLSGTKATIVFGGTDLAEQVRSLVTKSTGNGTS